LVESPDGEYYRTKNAGIAHATGEIIALADADCSYSPDWLTAISETFQNDADVSVGFTVLAGASLFRRLCGFYDLHSMLLRLGGKVRRFNSNNVAFRAELIRGTLYDERFERTGGCVQLAERLLRSGTRMRFNPRQRVVHRYYGFHRHTWIQAFCNGYDIFHTRAVDPTMPLARLVRLRYLALPFLSGIFMAADGTNIIQNRKLLAMRWYEFPVFVFFSIIVRMLELVGMYWALLHPKSIARFVKKNFA
ncbi:MAG: glycosyltransferase family 2 protein, partial [Bacteroidota bacterium]